MVIKTFRGVGGTLKVIHIREFYWTALTADSQCLNFDQSLKEYLYTKRRGLWSVKNGFQ